MNKSIKLNYYDTNQQPTPEIKQNIIDFLFVHLDQYGDKKEDIEKCLNYSMTLGNGKGGFIVTAVLENEIVGATIINDTGMKGYIPENILVYIAVNGEKRGMGIGKKLMNAAIEKAEGAIALHVEPDNPARYLYEKIGFTSKYLEMRYYPS
ncbi:MAG: GNAT family N-acetyltransferase [Saprospirales bacterium]|nr:MAG: GNAT family N-acetyltransferase [Saprospirales bacterium]